MAERLAKRISEIASEHPTLPVASDFLSRVKEGQLTRDENPYTHFCVYFAGASGLCQELLFTELFKLRGC